MLPDVAEIVERAQSVPQSGLIKASYALDATTIWHESSQQALGGIVQSIGVPAFDIFRTLVDEFKIDPAQDIVRKLEEGYGTVSSAISAMNAHSAQSGGKAMKTAASAGVETGVSLISGIPNTVSLVVQLAWTVATLVSKIVTLAKAQKEYGAVAKIWPKSRFDPRLDNEVLNLGLLDQVRRTQDWTRIFSPPSLGVNIGTLPSYLVKRIDGGGEIFRTSGRTPEGLPQDWIGKGWLGMVPGTATLHSGIRFERGVITEVGDALFPSARGIATWVWKQCAGKKPLSAVFTIHADAMANTWEAYIHQLHVWLNETDAVSIDDKARIMKRFNNDGGKVFNWGTSIAPVANEVDKYQPRRMANSLRERQFAACDTLLIAYVTEDFGAFQDPQLRDRFRARRLELLTHPDRCLIDLDNVIDPLYRDTLKAKGVGTVQCARGPQAFTTLPRGEPFTPDLAANPDDDGGLGGLGGTEPKRKHGGSLTVGEKLVGGAALAAALAWWVWKK